MEKSKLSDKELISLYRNGNEGAFEVLLNRHKARVYTTICLIVKDKVIAQDILQDVLMKVVKYIKDGKYNEEGKFIPWIQRIAHNMSIDHYRKEKRYPQVVFEDGTEITDYMGFSNSSEEDTINRETKDHIKLLIEQLPSDQREVLIMRHYMSLSFKEIAEKTGVSINTALGRMRYAIINLRKSINKQRIAYDQDFYPK